MAFCRVIVFLGWILSVTGVFGESASPTALEQHLIEDFNKVPIDGEIWHTYPRAPGNSIRFRLDASERQGERGHSLHLSYTFASAKAAEIGFRLKLPALDASAYDHLVFWVKGDKRQGFATSFKVEFKRPEPNVPGLKEKGSFVVTGVIDAWRRVWVPLNFMTGLRQWTELTDLVISFHSRRSAIKQGAYYFDEIVLLKTDRPGPSVWDKVIPIKKKNWEAALGGREAAKSQLQARLVGWPSRFLTDRKSLPRTDREFLWRLARDTWRGLEALQDRLHGLPIDNVRFGTGSVELADAQIGDYTSLTNIGLHLIAVVAAHELGLITAAQALERLRTTLATLERLETYQGFFYNYYDTTTLERTSNFISFVDSAWLTAGLMVARMSFPEVHGPCTALIERGDYGFFYDTVAEHMRHGYYVNLPSASEYHYGVLYAEPRIGSLIAIGKGDVPAVHWFRTVRTFPPEYTWQSQRPRAYDIKVVRGGYELYGGYYRWQGVDYIPSWGGSMFEALMPTLVLDEPSYAPESLGRNDRAHAEIQRRHALEALGYPVWGLSPSSTPDGNGYSEYGVKVLGSRGYGAGAVTPHAAALALSVTPLPAIANLRELAERYEVYGEYGFYDAVEPVSGEVAPKYLALDQSMLFIAVANYLKDHCIQRRFASDPIARRALPILRDEDFFD